MNQTNTDLLREDNHSISYWDNQIVKNENLFNYFLQNKNFDLSNKSLKRWLNFFKRQLGRNKINKESYENLLCQWKHAAKLFVCAKFVEENRESYLSIKEKAEGKLLPDQLQELLHNLFLEIKIETVTDESIFTRDESILISSIFYENSLPSEVRRIPFATVSKGEKGRLYRLELRRIKSHCNAIFNPCIFPFSKNDSSRFGAEFSEAINLALQININQWNKEKKKLNLEINEMEPRSKRDLNKSELQGKKKDLAFMESLGDITRYGILWDVKPYQFDNDFKTNDYNKQETTPPIYGKSIGLAAYYGIFYTLRDKFPDERAIFSAALVFDSELRITGVDKIPAKIKAVIEINNKANKTNAHSIPIFDTFGIHKDNWKDEILEIAESGNIQLFVFDDDGSKLKT